MKLSDEVKQLEIEKETVIESIKDTFKEILNTIKDYEDQLVNRFTAEYANVQEMNQKSLGYIQNHIKLLKDLNAVESKIKQLNKVSFLNWSCRNSDFIDQISNILNYEITKPQVSFNKDDELCLLSKLIYNKFPFEVLTERNKTSMAYQPQLSGEKIISTSQVKNTLSK